MVRPRVRVHTSHDCATVRVHDTGILIHDALELTQAIQLEEQIQLTMEMVEREMEEVQVHLEEIELEKLEWMEAEIEHQMEGLEERLKREGGEM
jgi:hypothetical protein